MVKSTRMMFSMVSHQRNANQNHNEIPHCEISHNEITTPKMVKEKF